MLKFKIKDKFPVALLFLIALVSASCEQAPSMRANNTTAATPLPAAENAEKLTSLQREIRDMEAAGFKIVYVFKRKDDGVLVREDKNYLSANRPVEANRFVLTDDEKAIVVGSNYPFSPESLENLKKRFAFEDYSKPIVQVEVSANGNANANTNKTPEQKP